MTDIVAKPHAEMTEAERDALAEAQFRAAVAGRLPVPTLATASVPMVDLKRLRKRLGLTQAGFAERFGFALAAVRNWEQSRRLPDRSTRILLRLIEREPDTVARIASEI